MLYGSLDLHPRINGYSGSWPTDYERHEKVLNTYPAPAAVALGAHLHVRFLILHVAPLPASHSTNRRRCGRSWPDSPAPPRAATAMRGSSISALGPRATQPPKHPGISASIAAPTDLTSAFDGSSWAWATTIANSGCSTIRSPRQPASDPGAPPRTRSSISEARTAANSSADSAGFGGATAARPGSHACTCSRSGKAVTVDGAIAAAHRCSAAIYSKTSACPVRRSQTRDRRTALSPFREMSSLPFDHASAARSAVALPNLLARRK